MRQSPQWRDDRFVNPQPLANDLPRALRDLLDASPYVTPRQPLLVAAITPAQFRLMPSTGLRVTWFGHSSTLVEIDGVRVLTDPIWSHRASPTRLAGPQRWNPPLLALADLPPIDAVIVSHDHYDHLDRGTIRAMLDWTTVFIVPLGLGAHLEAWGVPAARIVELDWWQSTTIGAAGRTLEIVATPARHASGRMLLDNDRTLWAGFALVGPSHRVWYSGDTGLFPGLTEIGRRLGPFDLTMIEVGQYGQAWPDWHLGPEQAVRAHALVNGRVMLPVHWGLFALAYHGWTEPIERAMAAADSAKVPLLTPRPGESVEPVSPPPNVRWWPAVPWTRGSEDPIVATRMGEGTR